MLDRKIRLRRGATTAVGMATAVALLASCGATGKDNGQNTLKPKGPAAHKILNLMTPFFWVAVVVGVGVFVATVYVALRFREKPGLASGRTGCRAAASRTCSLTRSTSRATSWATSSGWRRATATEPRGGRISA